MSIIQNLKQAMDAADLSERNWLLSRNEFLVMEGKTDRNIYFVESGSIRIYILDEEEELTIRFGYTNDFVVALDSFISDKPTVLNIVALKKSSVRRVSYHRFMSFIKNDPQHSGLWDQMLMGLVLQQFEREVDILISSPEMRYKRVLARSPKLFQEIPSRYIASYLRMTPETLSRLKKS